MSRSQNTLEAHKAAAEAFAKGDLDLAHKLARKALRHTPTHAASQYLLGAVLERQGEYEQGLRLMLAGLQGNPSWEAALSLAAHFPKIAATNLPARLRELAQIVLAVISSDRPHSDKFYPELFNRLQFKRVRELARLAAIHDHLLLPMIERALNVGRHNLALYFIAVAYENYVKANERESHFAAIMKAWRNPLSAGARQVQARNPRPWSGVSLAEPYKIAFIVDGQGRLAHTSVLISFLESYQQSSWRPFVPVVVASAEQPVWSDEVTALGIEVLSLETLKPGNSPVEQLLLLRQWLHDHGVVAVVQVSVMFLIPYSFNLPLAPVQIWWSLKYHAYELAEVDGYVTGGATMGKFANLHGRLWRSGRPGYQGLFSAKHTDEAAKIRATFPPDAILLGAFAREAKFKDADFLSAIAKILQQNPRAHFLWSGNNRDAVIDGAFVEAGVADRTHFVGWINTLLYAQVLDVFLDSFPFGCGLTLYQAMAAGKPFILFDSLESRTTGLACFISPTLAGIDGTPEEQADIKDIFSDSDGASLYFLAKDTEEYIAMAGRMVEDAALRERAGRAARKYAESYLGNPTAMANSYTTHFDEIVREKVAALNNGA